MKLKIILEDRYADVELDDDLLNAVMTKCDKDNKKFALSEVVAFEISPYIAAMLMLEESATCQ